MTLSLDSLRLALANGGRDGRFITDPLDLHNTGNYAITQMLGALDLIIENQIEDGGYSKVTYRNWREEAPTLAIIKEAIIQAEQANRFAPIAAAPARPEPRGTLHVGDTVIAIDDGIVLEEIFAEDVAGLQGTITARLTDGEEEHATNGIPTPWRVRFGDLGEDGNYVLATHMLRWVDPETGEVLPGLEVIAATTPPVREIQTGDRIRVIGPTHQLREDHVPGEIVDLVQVGEAVLGTVTQTDVLDLDNQGCRVRFDDFGVWWVRNTNLELLP